MNKARRLWHALWALWCAFVCAEEFAKSEIAWAVLMAACCFWSVANLTGWVKPEVDK